MNRQDLVARDFASDESVQNGGILYVFPILNSARMEQKIRWTPWCFPCRRVLKLFFHNFPPCTENEKMLGLLQNSFFVEVLFRNLERILTGAVAIHPPKRAWIKGPAFCRPLFSMLSLLLASELSSWVMLTLGGQLGNALPTNILHCVGKIGTELHDLEIIRRSQQLFLQIM